MVIRTRFTALLGCRLPIQQAGMGAVATPALAAAVTAAGGLGMLGAAGVAPHTLGRDLRAVRTAGPVGVNFLMPFLDIAAVEAASAEAALLECFYGDPDAAVVERMRGGGALAAWQVGSVDEARRAVDAGCDLVVAQGVEAGGHVRGTVPLMRLLDEVLHAVGVPVVAAGGIASARAVAALLDAGADAVRIGTRFLAAVEADVHPDYVAALVASGSSETELTQAFSMGWPNAPHRVLRRCIDASDADPAERSPLPPTRAFEGDVASAALYAGHSVDGVRRVETAAAIVDELVAGVPRLPG